MCGRYKLPGDWQERVNDQLRFKGIGTALDPEQYDTWLTGSPEEAKALAVAHQDPQGFTAEPETELP